MAADVICEAGARVHLAHPLGIAGFENRRVKNDGVDARLLADLLRMGRLPESWIPPESVRHQRELVRYRRKLSQLRAGLKAQVGLDRHRGRWLAMCLNEEGDRLWWRRFEHSPANMAEVVDLPGPYP